MIRKEYVLINIVALYNGIQCKDFNLLLYDLWELGISNERDKLTAIL